MNPIQAQRLHLRIEGMTCINCQTKIEKRLSALDGVESAVVSWKRGTADIVYHAETVSEERIAAEIAALGYHTAGTGGADSSGFSSRLCRALSYALVVAAAFLLFERTGVLNLLVPGGLAASGMSYALLFVTGLFTSVHCVAMCGGINLSQSLPRGGSSSRAVIRTDFLPALLYNAGRVASYTLIGLALGTAGHFVAGGAAAGSVSVPLSVQGTLKLLAGVFMVLTGISLLDIFPPVKRVLLHLPAGLSKRIGAAQARHAKPLFVGFLNGFMPCGPLQAMWIVAFVSGSPLSGALSMLAFALGTVPLMLGLGSVVTLIGKKYTEVVMRIGALLVIVMGLSMLSQGFALGAGGANQSGPLLEQGRVAQASAPKKADDGIVMRDGKQVVTSTLNPYRYPTITVKKGIPVQWELTAPEGSLNGCNYKMVFREYGFMYSLGYGKNIIEFTPERTGTIPYSCWMGMIRGTIKVTD